MQKLNTLLLLVVICLLSILVLRPQPGCYEHRENWPYIFDTATGEWILHKSSAPVLADLKGKEDDKARQTAEADASRQRRLAESCPGILKAGAQTGSRKKGSRDAFDMFLEDRDRKECEEWLAKTRSSAN